MPAPREPCVGLSANHRPEGWWASTAGQRPGTPRTSKPSLYRSPYLVWQNSPPSHGHDPERTAMPRFFDPSPDERRALEQTANGVPEVQQTFVEKHPQLTMPDRGAHQQ